MQATVHDSIQEIPAREWNALAGRHYPFLRYEFLCAAEVGGCVSAEAGWTPRHITISDGGTLRAAMPLYEKAHSWGEFVFDWAWASAYHRAGVPYYPKLVSAAPFTPVTSRRLLLADADDRDAAMALIRSAIAHSKDTGCSSLHILFPLEEELSMFRDAGLRIRKDCQFHWHNRNYTDFDEFLQTFNAVKRKKVKRDRRHVTEAGIRFRRLHGKDIDDDMWQFVYRMISITFMRRGSLPYFDLDFFRRIGEQLPESILVILAEQQDDPVAAAVFFESDCALYGRYWGSSVDYNALHFETCYYQGIEYCIDTGKSVFEPGTQGEHKISRGFVPVPAWSAHWLAEPKFFSAIGEYLDQETRHVEHYMRAVNTHSPYRKPRDQS